MATIGDCMEYLILLLSGITLTCASLVGYHNVIYQGQTEVIEGDAFQIFCELPIRDPPLWTIDMVPILEENNLGYQLKEGEEGSFRRQMILQVSYAQLYQEGEYRCNRNSRDFHYVTVVPALDDVLEEEDDDDEDEEEEDDPRSRLPYEYKMVISESYEFSCTTAKDEDTSVTWYKNGGRIINDPNSNVEVLGRDLIILDAEEEDAGEYMCIVEPQFDKGLLGEGRIFRLVSQTAIIEFPDVKNIVQGDTLELHCRTRGYPEPKITWLIGNLNASELAKKDRRISLHGITKSLLTLIIRNTTISDGGLYTCKANNTVTDETDSPIDEESVFVHVRENMIQTNEDYPGMGKVLIPGEPLVLVCNTTECPHCTVVWFKDGELLINSSRIEIFGNNTIYIEDTTYKDSGVYTCKINRAVLDVDLAANIVVQSRISLKKFDQSDVVVQGSPLELCCQAEGGPMPQIKWYIGDEEVGDDDDRIQIQDYGNLKNGKLYIEEADWPDRNYYTCEAFNQIDSVNTTTFIRIKDKLAALWPFLGICVEVAILCTIIFVYERRKNMAQAEEPDTDLPTENKHHLDQKAKGQDVRQRK